jgi:hypothetical protein
MQTWLIIFLLLFFCALSLTAYRKHLIRLESRVINPGYSIGVYRIHDDNGKFTAIPHPRVKNPVLTGGSMGARFVADPFVVHEGNRYYLFFEEMIGYKGSIAYATSVDGLNWRYDKVIVSEEFHLSYPCVFKWGNAYYMIPESGDDLSIRLYRASHFPDRWEFVTKILEGDKFADSTIAYYNGYWWLFTCTNGNRTLWLYYSDRPDGPWIKHPKNPIVKSDTEKARPGGPLINWEGRLLRIAQSTKPHYGYSIGAFEILHMNRQDYEERELQKDPILIASGKGWNADGMHHLSLYTGMNNEILAIVDGNETKYEYKLSMMLPSWTAKPFLRIRQLLHLIS